MNKKIQKELKIKKFWGNKNFGLKEFDSDQMSAPKIWDLFNPVRVFSYFTF